MSFLRLLLALLLALSLAVVLLTCSGQGSKATLPQPEPTVLGDEPALDGRVMFCDDDNLRWGIKSDCGTLLDKGNFVINHSAEWKIPYWVGYHLSVSNLKGSTSRTDDFRADTDLPLGKRSELSDYRSSGYDRGHNAPAASFKRGRDAMSATFLLSNMSPQCPSMNRHLWRYVEAHVRELVKQIGEGWVITGNICDFDDPLLGDTVFAPIGENHVAVPKACFKALLLMSADSTFTRKFYIVRNMNEGLPNKPESCFVSEDSLERVTEWDFFPIADSIENERRLRAKLPGTTATPR